jgi:hypothetical protein
MLPHAAILSSRTRDVNRPGSMSLQFGNLSECDAVGFEALPSVNSDPVVPSKTGVRTAAIVMCHPTFERLPNVGL